MATKDKKSAAAEAAKKAASEQEAPKTKVEKPEVKMPKDINPQTKGLTQGEKVSYLASLQTERAYMLNTEKPSEIVISGLTMLAQATILDIAVAEIASGTSVVGHIITANENNYKALQAMAYERGVKLPEFKALPAPTEEQLKQAGIIGLLPSETRVVTVETKQVSKEAIAKKKKEAEAVAKAVSNPAEIKSEDQLKASLTAMLVKPISEGVDRPDARVQRTIKFYRGYLTIQANAAENKEEALKAAKDKTMTQMLNEISEIVGPCPFALSGTAYFLRKRAAETGMPISSYCLYRRSAVPSADGSVDDKYMADITRTLLIWSCKSRITECEEIIKAQKKSIKNETGAAKVATETAIRANEANIQELNTIIDETVNPKFDAVDNLINNYNLEDTTKEEYKLAHRIVDDIMKTYYPEYIGKKYDAEAMLKNVQQRAGIIVNMFRDPLSQSIDYKEANLTEVEITEESEEKSEEEPKN